MYDFIHIIQFLIHIFFLFMTVLHNCSFTNENLNSSDHLFTLFNSVPWKKQVIHHATFQNWETIFFLFGPRKIWKSFPHIGKVFVKLGQNFGQNFTIFSKNQKQCQLPGVGLISKYRSLTFPPQYSKLTLYPFEYWVHRLSD